MRKFNLLGLSTIAIIAAALTGCSNSDSPKSEDVSTGARLALSANIGTPAVNYCILSDNITFTGTNPVRAPIAVLNDVCNNTPLNVSLQPGEYEVTVTAPTCTIDGLSPGAGYLGCALDPSPVALTVPLGGTGTAQLSFVLRFLNRQVTVFTGVGAGQLNVGSVTQRDLCGPSVESMTECGAGQTCATLDVDDATYMCYTSCTTTNAGTLNAGTCTTAGEMCVSVSGVAGVSNIGTIIPSLNAVPHVCATVSAPVAGTGGTSGVGGATGTGGSSSVAGASSTGGSSAAAGETSVGGTAGAAGSST